ncbi:hypothetical protein WJX81_004186 [Elliptochloris bilobata]|uniref:Phospholipid/glycerol acyltransferase domain-containing protein n=1 Tax=Elliptochloris bilobata TaxID=381761 RepID=A0AAW1RKT0_9CHLO
MLRQVTWDTKEAATPLDDQALDVASTSGQIALFPTAHVEQWTPGLILYFPVGCAVAAVRMALWVAVLLADAAWLTDNDAAIRVLQAVLGLDIAWRHAERLPPSRHVMVSNHSTTGDLMVLYSLRRRCVHLVNAALPARVTQGRNSRVLLRHATKEVYEELASPDLTDPVHIFPEGGMTSGAAMMRFSRGFMRFAGALPVVPVALRADLGPWRIHTHTLTSGFLANLFWFSFPPRVRLEATVLPSMAPAEGESKAQFVERVQQALAAELGVPISDVTLQAKRAVIAGERAKAGQRRGMRR